MQLTEWVHEAIWISKVKVIHWPWSKVTQSQYLQTSFPEKTAKPIEVKFHVEPQWDGGTKVQTVQVTWPRWPPCSHMVKHEKFFFSGTKKPMTLNVCMQYRLLEYYQVFQMMTLDWPWPILRQGQIWSPIPVLEKVKTMYFSETIVVYDIKVGRCSQLNEYMKLYECQRSSSLTDLGLILSDSIFFRLLFLNNH